MSDFTWTPELRERVERRARSIRRRRHRLAGAVAAGLLVVVGVAVGAAARGGGDRVAVSTGVASLTDLLPDATSSTATRVSDDEVEPGAVVAASRTWETTGGSATAWAIRFTDERSAIRYADREEGVVQRPIVLVGRHRGAPIVRRSDDGRSYVAVHRDGDTVVSWRFHLERPDDHGVVEQVAAWTTKLRTGVQVFVGTVSRQLLVVVPSGWARDDRYTDTLVGKDGYVGLSAATGPSLDELARTMAEHVLHPFGTSPEILSGQTAGGLEARTIAPSADAPADAFGFQSAAVLVQLPEPIRVGSDRYGFAVLDTDLNHAGTVLNTFQVLPG